MGNTTNQLVDALGLLDALQMRKIGLEHKQQLFGIGDEVRSVYFPINAIVSVVAPLSTGESLEVAMVGRDGGVGFTAWRILMPVYYFNLLIDDVLCADTDGKDLPDGAAALAEARASARELIAEAVRHNVPVPASYLLINDAEGVELLTINLDISPLLRQLGEP